MLLLLLCFFGASRGRRRHRDGWIDHTNADESALEAVLARIGNRRFAIKAKEDLVDKFAVHIGETYYTLIITNYAIRFVPAKGPQTAIPIIAVIIIQDSGPNEVNVTSSVKKSMVVRFDENMTAHGLKDIIEKARHNRLQIATAKGVMMTSEPDYLLKESVNRSLGSCSLFHNYHKTTSLDGLDAYGWHCRTYSPRDIVPGTSEMMVRFSGIIDARQRNRYPVVSYVARGGGVLLRCSQPATGYDVSLIACEKEAAYLKEAFPGRQFSVYDLRPAAAAFANLKRGGGYEDISMFGKGAELNFSSIENILIVSKAFEHDQALWKKLIYVIFDALAKIVASINDGRVVLIHCTDGWDRTPQMASLPQIMLEPGTRTIRGFLTLIIREFSRRGHNLGMRNSGEKPIADLWQGRDMLEKSPIVVQFIDVIYQLMSVNPTAFEFNAQLLEFIVWHCYTGQFGELMGDDAMIRLTDHNEHKDIISHVLEDKQQFMNAGYDSNASIRIPSENEYSIFAAIHTCDFPGGCRDDLY